MAESGAIEEARAHFQRAYEAQMAGRLDEAVDLYRRSIALHPTAEAHTFLGWTYSFQGRHEDAIAECHTAIAVDPDFGNPYNDIGAYLIELGRHAEAIPWLERAKHAARYEPRHFPYFNLARVYVKDNRLHDAIRELRGALRVEPRYEIARRELVRVELLVRALN
jgi:Tfp pilus assembly protein PilF